MNHDEILLELRNRIVKGNSEGALDFIHKAIDANIDPKQILNKAIIHGAEEVGRKYEEDEYFLGDMLLAADAMNECMDVIKPILTEEKHKSAGKVLIGTPEGDIHDIGKRLVVALLQGQGFEVIDLGVDVPPEKFVKEAININPDIIGISGLLTMTISKMTETVVMLRKGGIKAKIVVGGGILSEESCQYIGANAWAKDGWEGVKTIKELMEGD
ncbi:MAG: B12-binding domain-containing protein [Candidatus Hermodarchaeota archaeon]